MSLPRSRPALPQPRTESGWSGTRSSQLPCWHPGAQRQGGGSQVVQHNGEWDSQCRGVVFFFIYLHCLCLNYPLQ